MRPRTTALLASLFLVMSLVSLPAAGQQACQPLERQTETLSSGVTLSWDGSFWCADNDGSFQVTMVVEVNPSSAAVGITDVVLRHTTPRPRGTTPSGSFTAQIDGLTVTVTGNYSLVTTDEGAKANIHFTAVGTAEGEPFRLGFNVHLRGEGAVEDGGNGDGRPPNVGPPSNPGPPHRPAPSQGGDNGNGAAAPGGPLVQLVRSPVGDGERPGAEVVFGYDDTGRLTITIHLRLPHGVWII